MDNSKVENLTNLSSKSSCQSISDNFTNNSSEELKKIIEETNIWLNEHNIDNTTQEEFLEKIHQVEGFSTPIIKMLYSDVSGSSEKRVNPLKALRRMCPGKSAVIAISL